MASLLQTINSFASPLKLRIALVPISNIPKELVQVFSDLYNTIQQIFQAFTTHCGVGQQPVQQWSLLAGQPDAILAQNVHRFYAVAKDTIAEGSIINLFRDVDGILKIQLASANSLLTQADGYCSTVGGIGIGTIGEVILTNGTYTYNGVSTGMRYYLALGAGTLTTLPPSSAGTLVQYMGLAIKDNIMYYNIAPQPLVN